MGDFVTALKELDVLVEAAPKDKRAHFGRGAALLALGQKADAIAALEKALALDPDYADARAKLDEAKRA
jgi:Flp pilus assembly protein TadD